MALMFGAGLFLIGLYFVWRSFYGMRITKETIREAAARAASGRPAHQN
jgi:hypothetical protein